MKGWVGLGGCYVMRQFTCPKAVTHPSTNRARCRATALIETNALPLHQTANHCSVAAATEITVSAVWRLKAEACRLIVPWKFQNSGRLIHKMTCVISVDSDVTSHGAPGHMLHAAQPLFKIISQWHHTRNQLSANNWLQLTNHWFLKKFKFYNLRLSRIYL